MLNLPKINHKGSVPAFVLIAVLAILVFLFISFNAPLKDKLFSFLYPKPSSEASGPSKVSISEGKLFVDGSLFKMKAINYNPVSIGSDQVDPSAPTFDVPKMAALGANTIATYTSTKFEWQSYTNAGSGDIFYDNLVKASDLANIKLIPGYFSNQAIDWTDSARVAIVTQQYQGLVLKARDRPSTLIYMIGNETFEKLSSDSQKIAYAKWIGSMVDWTRANDPNHLVMYADNDQMAALNYLKTYAPNLDVYGYNNYVWSNTDELKIVLNKVNSSWPNKPYLLHEWGVDSFDVSSYQEKEDLQASRILQLRSSLDQVYADPSFLLLGDIIFEYSDDWNKLGSSSVQTPDNGWPWGCKTSFDSKCNEEYWGLAKSSKTSEASTRILKQSYQALASIWSVAAPSLIPSYAPSPTVVPTPQPSQIASDSIPPIVSITYPKNGSIISRNSAMTITANASDNIAVSKVEFYLDGGLKCTDTFAPYTCTTKIGGKPGSTRTIQIKAYDSSGNTALSSVTVTSK